MITKLGASLMPNRETVEAYALATIGAINGLHNYYVKPAIQDSISWIAGKSIKKLGFTMPDVDFDELDAAIEEQGRRMAPVVPLRPNLNLEEAA